MDHLRVIEPGTINRISRHLRKAAFIGSLSVAVSFFAVDAKALQPEEIAIIASRGSKASRSVAAYYAKVRAIPTSNILQLDLPAGETLPRATWQQKIRPAIRSWLAAENRLRKIKCFVTTWDVPLKIGVDEDPKEVQRIVGYLKRERSSRVGIISSTISTMEQLAGGQTQSSPFPSDASLEDMAEQFRSAYTSAQDRINGLTDETQKAQQLQIFRATFARTVGLNSVAQSLATAVRTGQGGARPELVTEFNRTTGRARGLREGRAVLETMPIGLDREPQLLSLIQMTDGLLGSIGWVDEQIESLEKNETEASFDSELSLAAWPDYQLVRWMPNYLHYRYDDSPIRNYRISMMVSRLEGPDLATTRKLIDDAVAAEKSGLTGKIYLDGRGLYREGQTERVTGLIPAYDQLLVNTAEVLREASTMEVVLDTNQTLFAEGSAPDAALYCGWYSLAKYVDAFDFQPGAVAYHLGGAEAATLRDPNSQLWCKSLLADGAAATLGPVKDGPVGTFPRPNEFFAVLLSGRYTLVESYYRCNPLSSWTMTVVGDPLYSPFKANPPLDVTKLPEELRRVVEGTNAVLK